MKCLGTANISMKLSFNSTPQHSLATGLELIRKQQKWQKNHPCLSHSNQVRKATKWNPPPYSETLRSSPLKHALKQKAKRSNCWGTTVEGDLLVLKECSLWSVLLDKQLFRMGDTQCRLYAIFPRRSCISLLRPTKKQQQKRQFVAP